MTSKNKYKNKQPIIQVEKSNTIFFDFITLFFIVGLLIIDFLPNFRSIEIIGTQYLYLSIINILTGICLYYNPSLVSEKLISLFKKSWPIKHYILFLLLCGISIFSAGNFSLAIVCFIRIIIIFITFINLAILLNDRLYLIYKIAFLICLSIFFQAFHELYKFIHLINEESIVSALGQLKGNTGNINIFSANLSIKSPFLLIGVIYFKNWKKWFFVFTFFLLMTLIFLSGSRAAYLSISLEILIFFIFYIKQNFQDKTKISNLLYFIIPIALAFLIANQIFERSNDESSRYMSVINRTKQITNLNDASISYRLTLWKNATKMIQKNPITGFGLGNWKIESIPYEKTLNEDFKISDHPHDDFIEITTETGVINGLVYLSFFILLIFINLKRIIKQETTETKTIALIALLLITSYLVDATFNFPLYRPTMQIGFCLLFALTILNDSNNNESIKSAIWSKLPIFIISISIITLFFTYKIFKTYQLENDINSDFITQNFTLSGNDIINRLTEYPNVLAAGEPFVIFAGKYFMDEQNYKQAYKYLDEGYKINPYIGRAEFYKSMICSKLGKNDSAFFYAKKALEIRPKNRNYYIAGINTAMAIKNTAGIIQVHDIYTQTSNYPDIWINTTNALINSNFEKDKVIAFIDKGLKSLPKDSLLIQKKSAILNFDNLSKGNTLSQELKFDKALVFYKKALEIEPSNPIIMQYIGMCYYNLTQYNETIVYLEKSIQYAASADGKIEYFLGVSYYNLNNIEKGCKYLHLAMDKNYSNSKDFVLQYCK